MAFTKAQLEQKLTKSAQMYSDKKAECQKYHAMVLDQANEIVKLEKENNSIHEKKARIELLDARLEMLRESVDAKANSISEISQLLGDERARSEDLVNIIKRLVSIL